MTVGELMGKMSEKPVYLKNYVEDMVIRSTPGPKGKTFARFSGEKEYVVKGDSNLVIDTILIGDEITRKEYYNY
jgi:hypothetical protein